MWIFKPNPVWNTARIIGSVGGKLWALSAASIVWKNLWIAPAVTETISDTAEALPNILEISSDIPWITDVIWKVASQVDALESLWADFQNFSNVTAYTGALWLIYIIGLIIWSEKGRLEALWGSIVWTAISASLFSEMYDTLKWNGRDLLGYLPMKFYDNLPDEFDNYLSESTNREAIYWIIAWIVWLITWKVVLGNFKTLIMWPKSKRNIKDPT